MYFYGKVRPKLNFNCKFNNCEVDPCLYLFVIVLSQNLFADLLIRIVSGNLITDRKTVRYSKLGLLLD